MIQLREERIRICGDERRGVVDRQAIADEIPVNFDPEIARRCQGFGEIGYVNCHARSRTAAGTDQK